MKNLALVILALIILNPAWSGTQTSIAPAGEKIIDMGTPKAWGLAADAILTEHNGLRHDMLGGWQRDSEIQKEYKVMFAKLWNVKNRDDLLKTLQQLEEHGTREEFEQLGKMEQTLTPAQYKEKLAQLGAVDSKAQKQLMFVHRWYKPLGKQSLIAFDLIRAIDLSRRGYLVGYLNSDEAWQHIFRSSKVL